jgi:SAM-dependent methyltransferase
VSVIWHDLECGGYLADLPLWRALAAQQGDPVLDLGAGTGRVALALARAGHRVTALDHDPELLAELDQRAHGLELRTVLADAREFQLDATFALCVMPMQTIQLLGGRESRLRCLACIRGHLATGALAAIALTDALELYEVQDGAPTPLPDICERDGVVYSSWPTAVRASAGAYVLERRRETVMPDGRRAVTDDAVRLDRVSPRELEREAREVGLCVVGRRSVPQTTDYAGSVVVMLRG